MNATLRSVGIGAIGLIVAIGVVACTGGDGESDDNKGGGGNKSANPPVLSSFVLDAGTETPQDVRVAIHGVRRVDGATVLDWSVTPLASDTAKAGDKVDQPLDIDVDPGFDNSNALQLVDTAGKKVYRPLDNDDQVAPGDHQVAGCLCVPWFMVKGDLTVGKTRLMQAAFPELPAGLDKITVSIRNQPLASDAPVAPIGEVLTGKGIDLNAKADDLPQAAPAASFTYPVGDSLDKPAQAMSLTINQVIAGPSGTSLVYTVKADAAGPGLNSFGGRPINDPEVVQYGTSVFDLASSGPAIAAAGAEGRLTRPWFASMKQKTEIPPGAAENFAWRECLCSTTQFYGKILETAGRSITLIEHMPALPSGTSTVDVVFPDKSLPTVKGVKVTEAPEVASKFKKADVGTWTYGSVETDDLPKGWNLNKWPTPVPDAASIDASVVAVDDLEEVFSDDVSVEKKEKKKVEVTLDSTVSFQPDSAKLTPKALSTIKRIAEDISKAGGSSVLVEGHVSGTDQGSKAVQQQLSEDRAQAVLKALKAAVGGDVTFKAVGRGAEEPVAPNDSEEHRKLNRRVVVTYDR
jgi:outer membrane protein OmpA-like peptidoglycan-associated protein